MGENMKRVEIIGAAIAVMLATTLATCPIDNAEAATQPVAQPKRCEISRSESGLVSATIVATPLDEALSLLVAPERGEIRWLVERGTEPITIRFRGLSLVDAIDRVLGGRSYTASLSDAPHPAARIWIGSRIDARTRPIVAAESGSAGGVAVAGSSDEDGDPVAANADAESRDAALEARLETAERLGLEGDGDEARDELTELLADPDAEVRSAAMIGLAQLGALSTEDLARAALDDADPFLRHQAVQMLHVRAEDDPAADVLLDDLVGELEEPALQAVVEE
jgi:hypothetical protein